MTESFVAQKKFWIIGILAALAMMFVIMFTLAAPASADFCISPGQGNSGEVGPVGPSGGPAGPGKGPNDNRGAWNAHDNSGVIGVFPECPNS